MVNHGAKIVTVSFISYNHITSFHITILLNINYEERLLLYPLHSITLLLMVNYGEKIVTVSIT